MVGPLLLTPLLSASRTAQASSHHGGSVPTSKRGHTLIPSTFQVSAYIVCYSLIGESNSRRLLKVGVSRHYQEEMTGKPKDLGPLEQSIFHIGSVTLDTFFNLSEP